MRLVLARDADAGVGDAQDDFAIVARDIDDYITAQGVFYRIFDEVIGNFAQVVVVDIDIVDGAGLSRLLYE